MVLSQCQMFKGEPTIANEILKSYRVRIINKKIIASFYFFTYLFLLLQWINDLKSDFSFSIFSPTFRAKSDCATVR